MPAYLYCGLHVLSDMRFPELPQAPSGATHFLFTLQRPRAQSPDETWSHHWFSPRGEIAISYRRARSLHVLRFPRLADFEISADARAISCIPALGVPRATIRHLLMNQVLPRCLDHRGELVLHASAVSLRGSSLLFIGATHSGKSTIAGSFHVAGYPALADDVVLIKAFRNRSTAVASYAGLCLWQDSFGFLFDGKAGTRSLSHSSAKQRIPLLSQDGKVHRLGAGISAIIVLSASADLTSQPPHLVRLPPGRAYIEVEKQAFRLDVSDQRRIRRHMELLGRVVSRVPVFRITMQRDFRSLRQARERILRVAAGLPGISGNGRAQPVAQG